MQADPYKILGVSPSANNEEIKRAFRKKALELHPDHNTSPGAADRFKELKEAYELLMDVENRRRYDSQQALWTNKADSFQQHYFEMKLSINVVKTFEEFDLFFIYSGEGRYLKKPDLRNFFITGKPFVTFKEVFRNGQTVKETTLQYILVARHTGVFTIGGSSVRINGKTFFASALAVEVKENHCYFTNDRIADGKPLQVSLWYDSEKGSAKQTYVVNTRHVVFIPRSHYAEMYHKLGSALKIIFTIWGMILAIRINKNVLLFMAGGSFYGALMVYLLYYITKVKSCYFHDLKYDTVVEYRSRGYQPFPPLEQNLLAKIMFHLRRLLW